MLSDLDRDGTFRCKVLEHGVGSTKNGFPQWTARLQAVEFFDPASDEYVPWAEYDMGIDAFLVLFNAEKALANYEQLQKAVGWDGASFDGLATLDVTDKLILVRVAEEEYNGKVRRKVQWVDHADADPAGGLKTLDTNALKGLNAQYKHLMAGKKAPVAPAKAPTPAPTPAPKAKATPPVPAAKAPETPAPTPKAKPKAKAPATEATKESAWAFLSANKPEDRSIDDQTQAWLAACQSVGGDRADSTFSSDDWAAVQEQATAILHALPE